jgi:hypothetical protein
MESRLREMAEYAAKLAASIPNLDDPPEVRTKWSREVFALVELLDDQVRGPLATILTVPEKAVITAARPDLMGAASNAQNGYDARGFVGGLEKLAQVLRDLVRRLASPPGISGKATVFFSWQSDIKAAACRTLIEDALDGAIKALALDGSVAVEPVIDRDTLDEPGAPDIKTTILEKIDAAAAFVADLTIIGETPRGRPTPNPNVLFELGYAMKKLLVTHPARAEHRARGAGKAAI